MNTINNKRSQETTAAIDIAFASLLKNKELNDITVSEICDGASINRSTFYERYADVDALANTYAAKIEKQIEEQLHTEGEFAWIFEYIKVNKDMFSIYFKLGVSQDKVDYKKLFFRSGAYSVAKMWFDDGCVESPEQMGEILKREHSKLM